MAAASRRWRRVNGRFARACSSASGAVARRARSAALAFSVALLSHIDRCTLGMVIDTAAVPDPEVLADCLAEGFEEVLAVGRAAKHAKPAKASSRSKKKTAH